jgi:uncharacterized BrkB/YihY/UPF0761 family membrane protein
MVIFLAFTIIVLPAQSAKAKLYSGAAGSPDTTFLYTAGDLYKTAEAYGQAGRSEYIKARFTFDLIWPLVYLAFLTSAISWLYHRLDLDGNLWKRVNLAPIFGVLFDYLENISTSIVMARFPEPTPIIASLAPIFTFMKWIFMGCSLLLLMYGSVRVIWKLLKVK